jgi:hypothetical protein
MEPSSLQEKRVSFASNEKKSKAVMCLPCSELEVNALGHIG